MGIRRDEYNGTATGLNWHAMESFPSKKTLATSVEIPFNYDSHMGNKYEGWFIPPETTGYKFHLSCDDYCEVYLGDTPD